MQMASTETATFIGNIFSKEMRSKVFSQPKLVFKLFEKGLLFGIVSKCSMDKMLQMDPFYVKGRGLGCTITFLLR